MTSKRQQRRDRRILAQVSRQMLAGPRVFIYCNKHAQRIPVASFYRAGDFWQIDSKQAAQQIENLAGDTLIPHTQRTPPDVQLERRLKYRLVCRLCGQPGHVQITDDRLTLILNRLQDAGVSELSLSGLSGVL